MKRKRRFIKRIFLNLTLNKFTPYFFNAINIVCYIQKLFLYSEA